jgi:hypothetical protein
VGAIQDTHQIQGVSDLIINRRGHLVYQCGLDNQRERHHPANEAAPSPLIQLFLAVFTAFTRPLDTDRFRKIGYYVSQPVIIDSHCYSFS